jgi:hypothetical protein
MEQGGSCSDPSLPVLHGTDVVAYFSLKLGEKAVLGSDVYRHAYGGNMFWFENFGNREAFVLDPEAYLPKWGGFCSWGVPNEEWWTADTIGPAGDPNVWAIVGGKLHIFMACLPFNAFLFGHGDGEFFLGLFRGSNVHATLSLACQ